MSICESVRSVYLLVLPQTKFHLFPRFQNNRCSQRKKETSKQKVFKPETNTETETKAFKKKEIQNQKAERDNRC
jgi:hypothetical protein